VTSTLSEAVEPSPVFVDQSGRRGRRLRGLGWAFGVGFVGVTLAMVSGLLGTQSDAPKFVVPAGADTLPPGQYVDAPQPAPPGKADRSTGAPRTAAPPASGTPTDTATAEPTDTATATATATPTTSPTATAHHTKAPPATTHATPTHTTPATTKPPASSTTAPPTSTGQPSPPAGPDPASGKSP
jgi:hypothetical protein